MRYERKRHDYKEEWKDKNVVKTHLREGDDRARYCMLQGRKELVMGEAKAHGIKSSV
jgi:hypothetical protein